MDIRQQIAISDWVSDRTPRPLAAPLLTFELGDEAAALRSEPIWHTHGHNARTLVKHPELRVVLIALRAGTHAQQHLGKERMALQVIAGCIQVNLPTEVVQLVPGRLMALDREIPFAIAAVKDSDFLLWVGFRPE